MGGYNNKAGDPALTDHTIGQYSTVCGGGCNTASGLSLRSAEVLTTLPVAVTLRSVEVLITLPAAIVLRSAEVLTTLPATFTLRSAEVLTTLPAASVLRSAEEIPTLPVAIILRSAEVKATLPAATALRSAEVILEVQPLFTTGQQEDYGRTIDLKIRTSLTVLFLVLEEGQYGEADSTHMVFGNSHDVFGSTDRFFHGSCPIQSQLPD